MNDLGTVVARYRASLTAYVDLEYVPIATDKYGRILQSHDGDTAALYSSIRVGDGTDLLDILNIGDSVSGNTGIMVLGEDASGNAATIPIGDTGVIVEGSLDLDPTPGTGGDVHSDEAGANTEPGVVDSVTTGAWKDIVTIAVGDGVEYVLQSVQCVADRTSQFRLIIDDNGTPSSYIGNWMITQNVASYEFDLPRAREITGAANRSIKLQAIRRALGSTDANASGRINGFTR